MIGTLSRWLQIKTYVYSQIRLCVKNRFEIALKLSWITLNYQKITWNLHKNDGKNFILVDKIMVQLSYNKFVLFESEDFRNTVYNHGV